MSSVSSSMLAEAVNKINLFDALENSPKTQATVDQLERGIAPLNDYVFSLRDAFQMFIVHQAELQESVNSIAELLQKFEHTGASHSGSFLCQAMNELGKQLKELCSWQEMLGIQLANGVIQPLTNFLLNDLTRVQQKRTTFQAAAKEHEEATEKFSRVSKVRETDRTRFEANSDLYAARKQFQSVAMQYYIELNSLEYMKQCVLLQSMLSFMHSQLTHFKMGYDILTDEVGKFLTSVNIEAQRANNKLQHELKVMNKDRDKIEENFTSYYNPDPDPSNPFMEYVPPNLSLTYKAGYLFHKNRSNGKWERYYFLTREGSLYLQTSHKRDPVLVMRARGCNVAPVNVDDRRYTFEVTHYKFKQPLYFQAENTTSRDEWMATIRNISAFCGVEVPPPEVPIPPPSKEVIQNERNRVKEWVEEQVKTMEGLSPQKLSSGLDPEVLSSALSRLASKQEQEDKQRDIMKTRKELNEYHAQRDHLVTQKNTLEIKMSTLEQTKQQLLEQEQFNYMQRLEEASDEQKDQLATQYSDKVTQLREGFEKQVSESSTEVKQITEKITTLESKIHELASTLVQQSSNGENSSYILDVTSPESCVVGLKPLNYDFNQQFTVKFLGSTDVKEARGKGIITTTIRKVLAARAMQNVLKTQDSIMMVTQKKLQLLDSPSRKVTVQFSWKDIPFWGFHPDNDKLFGFTTVTQQGHKNKYTCHVFEAEKSGKAVLLAFSDAVQANFAQLSAPRRTSKEEVTVTRTQIDQPSDPVYEDVEIPIPIVTINKAPSPNHPPSAIIQPAGANNDYEEINLAPQVTDHPNTDTVAEEATNSIEVDKVANQELMYTVVKKPSPQDPTTASHMVESSSSHNSDQPTNVSGYQMEKINDSAEGLVEASVPPRTEEMEILVNNSDSGGSVEASVPPHTEEMEILVNNSDSGSFDDAMYEIVN